MSDKRKAGRATETKPSSCWLILRHIRGEVRGSKRSDNRLHQPDTDNQMRQVMLTAIDPASSFSTNSAQ